MKKELSDDGPSTTVKLEIVRGERVAALTRSTARALGLVRDIVEEPAQHLGPPAGEPA